MLMGMDKQRVGSLIEARRLVSSGDGQRIRELAGLSSYELARLARLSPSTIWRYENKKQTPSGVAALQYAEALEVIRKAIR